MIKLLFGSGGVIAAALIYILFKPVFAGQVVLNPTFSVGGFEVHYYGIALGTAIMAGYLVVRQNAWRFGFSKQETDRIVFWSLIVALLSARLYFVVFEYQYFLSQPSEIIKFWNGGISIYGAILGGIIFIWAWSRKKIYSMWQVLDLAALGLPLGQAIGRLGNLFNYEAYGNQTNLPWKMFVPLDYRKGMESDFFHPVFLYESIANLILFGILLALRGKTKPGHLALIYLMGYSAIRFSLEFIRLDSVFISGFRADQVISVLLFLSACTLFFRPNTATK